MRGECRIISGHWQVLQNVLNYTLSFAPTGRDDAVGQYIGGEEFNIIGQDIIGLALWIELQAQKSQTLSSFLQCYSAAGAGSQHNIRVFSGGAYNIDDVLIALVIDRHFGALLPQGRALPRG
jgi:hypothetical protein